MHKLVFFGAPGAGKGTISKIMVKELNIPQISTGDLFRQAIKDKTDLGLKVSSILEKGDLVPDELTIALVEERVKQDDCKNGYILDGFPRTMIQAKEWEKIDAVDNAIYFEIDDELVKKIKTSIRTNATPRHVPAKIIPIADIPYTISGKKVELAVKKMIEGQEVLNRDALGNPEALDLYKDITELQD